ncbi:unnamed protein product, partial [Musa textilis]
MLLGEADGLTFEYWRRQRWLLEGNPLPHGRRYSQISLKNWGY